ncbi:LuxR C-terminal-related transcriptional regulator [Streptomyces sp. H-KF8]|uniref:LuxR C-terminal-related transcriptional regulator n=2 Tax=Streptomyces TaxID=1883 RepID=UPI001F27A56F|nr:LuxR C-terminal-related transcriptional regulator [Streptomyces sp. H-KF8]
MLGDGLTDEGISRKMGVSIRTVRRTMADLMRRLNAQSRFQAGTEAVRRGWI